MAKELEIKELVMGKQYYFAPYCYIWSGGGPQPSIAELLQPPNQSLFRPMDVNQLDVRTGHYWIKCQLNNPLSDSLLLAFYFRALENVSIYLIPAQPPADYPLGPVRVRKFKRYKDLERLAIPPGRSTLYLQIRWEQGIYAAFLKEGLRSLSFYHGEYQTFWQTDQQYLRTFELLFLGAIGLMFLYNLILYFVLWDKSYLYYVCYLFFWIVRVLAERDYYADWVAPGLPVHYLWLTNLSPVLFTIFHLLFTRSFLDLRQTLPWANRLSIGLILLMSSNLILLALGPYRYFSTLYYLSLLASLTGMIVIAVAAVIKGGSKARLFYLAGSISMFVGLAIYVALPVNVSTVNVALIGCLIELTLFSLGLADKINDARKALHEERLQKAREKELIIEEKNQELEARVLARTQELQTSNTTKDYLLSVVSHDIRSPLSSISQLIALIRQGEVTEADRSDLLAEVAEQLGFTALFVDDLLLWSKSQMAQFTLQPSQIDIGQLLTEVTKINRFEAKTKAVELANLTHDGLTAWADQPTIKVIINNLLKNAIAATPRNGKITITAHQLVDKLQINVTDAGPGIAPEIMGHLFDPNLNNGRSGGIGLLLCKNFVEKNGGNLWVESTTGNGSTFSFTLPLTEPKP